MSSGENPGASRSIFVMGFSRAMATLLVSVISSITPTMLRLPNGASTRAPMSDSRASSQR